MRRFSFILAFVLVASLLLPLTASAAPAQSGGVWHQVQPGQTVFAIGRLYGISPYAIASANSLPNWNVIFAGQWLWIPSAPYPHPYPHPYPYPYCARSHYVFIEIDSRAG